METVAWEHSIPSPTATATAVLLRTHTPAHRWQRQHATTSSAYRFLPLSSSSLSESRSCLGLDSLPEPDVNCWKRRCLDESVPLSEKGGPMRAAISQHVTLQHHLQARPDFHTLSSCIQYRTIRSHCMPTLTCSFLSHLSSRRQSESRKSKGKTIKVETSPPSPPQHRHRSPNQELHQGLKKGRGGRRSASWQNLDRVR
jgi:hypothetical protein